jgi:organic radical activating enzyme
MIYKSDSVLKIDYSKKFSRGVIIFGTGNLGTLAMKSLEQKKIKIICFADNNRRNQNKKFKNYNVIAPEQLQNEIYNYPILICSLNFRYFKRQLDSLGVKDYHDTDFLFEKLDLDNSETEWSQERCKNQIDLYNYAVSSARDKSKLRLNSLDLVLTEKCSLKCKDCSNLMQYYAKPVDEDFDLLMKSLGKFMDSVDFIQEIRFIGGEPFMYKRIDEVINKVLEYSNFNKLVVFTNGTIVPKQEKVKTFQNQKIIFKISNYGEISKNVTKLENFLSLNKIRYISERVTRWQDCARIEKFDRPISLTKEIFGNCCVNEALTMLHGKLYLCPYSAHAENLDAIPKTSSDSIDLNILDNNDVIKGNIRSLVFNKEYLGACNWCNGRDYNVSNVEAALQTEKPLEYKKII